MKRILFCCVLCFTCFLGAAQAQGKTWFLTVAGLGGEPDYEQEFTQWASGIGKIVQQSDAGATVVTLTGAQSTRAALLAALSEFAAKAQAGDAIAVTLIGHGSFDGVEYKFNLPGPDLSAADLNTALNRIPARRQLVVLATSCSGGAIPALQRPGRAIVTATKSGTEKNAVVFGRYWLQALQDATADTDKDDTISALEAFQYADRMTGQYYTSQQRLATEHPSFEDAGKGAAVRAPAPDGGEGLALSGFTMVRLGAAQKAYADPAKHDLLVKKEDLERQIGGLRYEKAAMAEDDYQQQMKALLIQLATVQAKLDQP